MPTSGDEAADPIVLDTSAYSRLRAGNAEVLSLLARTPLVYLPVIVVGELEAAFAWGSRRAENEAMLTEFLDETFVQVIDVDRSTAYRYGQLIGALRKAGTPIPSNDVWIAAVAAGTDGTLVTFDRDFARIPGLRCVLLD
jgi:tRNA(fMet)-specific endonuclease VapC